MGSSKAVVNIDTALDIAVAHHQQGRLAEAEGIYRQILAVQPEHAAALHLLGVIAHQVGKNDQAVALISKSLALDPSNALAHNNLGEAYRARGCPDEALGCYQKSISLKPDYAEAHNNLGVLLQNRGRLDEAVACYKKTLALNPDYAEGYNNLGCLLNDMGRLGESFDCFQKAMALNPDYADAHNNAGNLLKKEGRLDEAVAHFQRALQLKPNHPEAYNNLGCVLSDRGKFDEAIACFQKSLAINPDYSDARINQSNVQLLRGQYAEALENLRRAVRIKETPQFKNMFVRIFSCICLYQDDAELRQLMAQALAGAWGRPGSLAAAALAFIKPHLPEKITADALFGPAELAPVFRDPLLLSVLENVHICGIDMEDLLTRSRLLILQAAGEGKTPGAEALAFCCALARQCFINEFVFAGAEDELEQAKSLRDKLSASLAMEKSIPALELAAVAAYFPLHTLPQAEKLLRMSWPEPVSGLLIQQVKEPLEEQRIRDTIPKLTAIDDSVSLLVRQQYEENPYPRWAKAPSSGTALPVDSYFRSVFTGTPFHPLGKKDRVDVLIAGCGTGQQPIDAAMRWNGAEVLAIDLSLSSLCYAQRKTREMGVRNIEYAQADIMKLGNLNRTFDVIESTGVLHHLADPVAGLEILLSLLRPGGFINLGLYSETARQSVVSARQLIAEQGYTTGADDIRRCRQKIISMTETSPLLKNLLSFRDFYSASECRDLLFHVQEHRFTLPQIKGIIENANLNFIGFVTNLAVQKEYRERFPGDIFMQNLDSWHIFETENQDTFSAMYQFWAQKPLA